MDSSDSGPPPAKRFMNGKHEGQVRPFRSDSRGGRPGRGFRGRGFSRGRGGGFRGGFRGPSEQNSSAEDGGSVPFSGSRGRGGTRGRGNSPFRGRGRSTSLSGSDDHAPGVRSDRGSFHSRGSFSGFRGRGGRPNFRGRGFSGRGGSSRKPELQTESHYSNSVISIYNLQMSKGEEENRAFVKRVLSDFKCFRVDIYGRPPIQRVHCRVQDDDTVRKACKDLNGRFVQDRQILVSGAGMHSHWTIPIVIDKLSESTTVNDLVEVLHECKAITLIGTLCTKAPSPHVIVIVENEDDVTHILKKSSTEINGSKIEVKRLDQKLVARLLGDVPYQKLREVVGSDIVFYSNKFAGSTELYFESSDDLETALKKVQEYNQVNKKKIHLERRQLHKYFYAEVCDVQGDVDDAELYSLMRKHGEITMFKRLDKDYYLIKQELNAAMAAMSLSDSKGCGGTLKFSWSDTRAKKKTDSETEEKIEVETSVAKNAEKTGKLTKTSVKEEGTSSDEEMGDEDDEEEEVDEDEDEDDEEEEEDEEQEEEEEEDENVVKQESEESDNDEVEVPVTKKKSKKNKDLTHEAPQKFSDVKQDRRPKKRKISSST